MSLKLLSHSLWDLLDKRNNFKNSAQKAPIQNCIRFPVSVPALLPLWRCSPRRANGPARLPKYGVFCVKDARVTTGVGTDVARAGGHRNLFPHEGGKTD